MKTKCGGREECESDVRGEGKWERRDTQELWCITLPPNQSIRGLRRGAKERRVERREGLNSRRGLPLVSAAEQQTSERWTTQPNLSSALQRKRHCYGTSRWHDCSRGTALARRNELSSPYLPKQRWRQSCTSSRTAQNISTLQTRIFLHSTITFKVFPKITIPTYLLLAKEVHMPLKLEDTF